MAWWKYLVEEKKISPSEAWHIRIIDAMYLAEIKVKDVDQAFYVNEIRKMNGASEEFLV